MADQPTPIEVQRKELEDEELLKRGDLTKAIFAWGEVRRRQGYHDGYVAGREAANKSFIEYLNQAAAEAKAKANAADNSGPQTYAPPLNAPRPTILGGLVNPSRGSTPSAKELVLDAMKKTPGLTGVELLQKIRADGFNLHERTFRTALFRLKVPADSPPEPGQIMAVKNLWYRVEDAPPEAVEALRRSRLSPMENLLESAADAADKIAQAAKGSLADPKEKGGQ